MVLQELKVQFNLKLSDVQKKNALKNLKRSQDLKLLKRVQMTHVAPFIAQFHMNAIFLNANILVQHASTMKTRLNIQQTIVAQRMNVNAIHRNALNQETLLVLLAVCELLWIRTFAVLLESALDLPVRMHMLVQVRLLLLEAE